jgi:hypothetical protein
LNEATFKFFYLNYNGGPEIIITNQDDIYSNLYFIGQKDYYLYSILKETDGNSVDESNLSELNNTELSTKFPKNPSSSNTNAKTKLANKIKNLNAGSEEKKKGINFNSVQEQFKELSQINEGTEIEISKDFEQSNYDSDFLKRNNSDNSNNIKIEDESNSNINNFNEMNNNQIKSVNSRPNYPIFNQGNQNNQFYYNQGKILFYHRY